MRVVPSDNAGWSRWDGRDGMKHDVSRAVAFGFKVQGTSRVGVLGVQGLSVQELNDPEAR